MAAIDEAIEQMLAEIDAERAAEEAALETLRKLPAESGPCPAAGLPARSGGGYSIVMCPLCFADLGPWTWGDGDRSWPLTTAHARDMEES